LTKIEIWPLILILWIGPTNFFSKTGPPHSLIRPCLRYTKLPVDAFHCVMITVKSMLCAQVISLCYDYGEFNVMRTGNITAVAKLYIQSENHRNICCRQSRYY